MGAQSGRCGTGNEFVERFWGFWQDLEPRYARYARAHSLSYVEYLVLDSVYRNGPLTQRDLCDATLMPKQTVNSIVARLVDEGIVELAPLESDRRSKDIRLTAQGEDRARCIIGPVDQMEAEAFAQLSDDDRACFFACLSHLSAFCGERLDQLARDAQDCSRSSQG